MKDDIVKLKTGTHVVVGTPGRVLDMLTKKFLKAENLKIWFWMKLMKCWEEDLKNLCNKLLQMYQEIFKFAYSAPPCLMKF